MSRILNKTHFGDPKWAGRVLSSEAANNLMEEWVLNPRLRLHMRQIAGLMRSWAAEMEKLDEADQWRWEMAGLLHDADWDQWPDQHCQKIVTHLEELEIDPEIIRAIASHGPAHFGVDPLTRMDKMLYAFDELSGLIHAYSLMRPGGYDGMEVKGVKKRLKEKGFAANVNREEITDACQRSGVGLDALIAFIIPRQAAISAASMGCG